MNQETEPYQPRPKTYLRNDFGKVLKNFYDSSPMLMGIVEVAENDIFHISDNVAAMRFFGHDNSMDGKWASELGISESAIAEWIKHYTAAYENNAPVKFDYWHETGNDRFHFTATVNFIEIGESGLPCFSYFVSDTTAIKDAQVAEKRHESFFEAVIDNIPDMIFVKEAKELRFIKLNKACEEFLGIPVKDMIGKNDHDFFPAEQADFFNFKDRQVFEDNSKIVITQEPIETRSMGTRILRTKKIPIFNSDGESQYLVGISEDITEKIQTEEVKIQMLQEQIARQEVEKSLRGRDEFISIISHELKSPLFALKLQAQMFFRNLKKNFRDGSSEEKLNLLIQGTLTQVERLERLVNDMLDVSRIRTGKFKITKTELNLVELVKGVFEKMKVEFMQSACGVPKLISNSKEIIGHWDKLRIEQVMVNLLTNAIHYGKGSPIEVSVESVNSTARIRVRDYGIGIAEEHIEKIFNRFERAIERSEVSGLGLGLFISSQLIEAHNGKIWAESKKGEGASFFVELPLGI